MGYIGEIALILFATTIAGALSQRASMPIVIGQLLVGILLGPAVLGWVRPDSLLHAGAEIGVIILMFIAGLESDLQLLKKYFRPAISVATLGVILPMVVFYIYGEVMHQGFERSLFWGVVFSATSVSISVEVLREFGRLNSKEGATVLGAAVVDDILAVLILSVFVSMFGNVTGGQDSSMPLWQSLLLQVAYFVMVYLIIRWLAPHFIRLFERLPVPQATSIMSLVLCMGMAYLADLTGLSAVIGAFFAGIAIAQTPAHKEVTSTISPIGYAFFVPIFFVSVGLDMRLDHLLTNLLLIIGLTIAALLTKLIGGGLGARFLGFNLKSSYVVGAGMISRGEMALIIAQIGYEAHLLAPELYSEIIIVIVLSTVLAPLMLKHAISLLPSPKAARNDD
ncbi:sodium:proton antiporter [Secundilactobacillus kimchicus]|uniref:Na+ H+ antiporter n=1 Tax=Secundilactobacillus kimchicus JCM 15530 TaxID=1302272 RepID=A0A0R1HY27_9LACO|nr:cation:proton antiporter [Secundilactobacillus kimchicus]KRK48804.1 Na+ H+ antiporter [Secundilactobacillus kimchicus JCM 15530]MBT9671987.1 sodium:proton antiporter [Secundilactobacillus kimchicus]